MEGFEGYPASCVNPAAAQLQTHEKMEPGYTQTHVKLIQTFTCQTAIELRAEIDIMGRN